MIKRIRDDREFRFKFMIWIFLCWSFIVLGWVMGQLGPSLLDLQQITDSSLEEASVFLTVTFIGYLVGAIISGAIFERMNEFLILFVGLFILAVSSAAIPFSVIYELMVFMHILKGVGAGILDSAGNSVVILKFRDEKSSRSFIQTIHFTFAIGGILSPIATAPFLMPTSTADSNDSLLVNTTRGYDFIPLGIPEFTPSLNENDFRNFSNCSNLTFNGHHSEAKIKHDSVLYKAYLISAGLCLIAAFPFILLFLFKKKESENRDHSVQNEKSVQRRLPLQLKVFILMLMCLFLGTDNGLEDTYFGFFTTFTVKEYGWTKKEGSYAASVYWAAYAFGRFLAIFIVPYFKPATLLKWYSILLVSSILGLFFSTTFGFITGVWIFSPLIGFAISIFFPSIFILTEEDFVPVTGRVASLLMFAASLGSMINPLIMGYLIDNLSPMWFLYITVGQSVSLLIMVWVATVLSWHVKKHYTVIRETEIHVETISTHF